MLVTISLHKISKSRVRFLPLLCGIMILGCILILNLFSVSMCNLALKYKCE